MNPPGELDLYSIVLLIHILAAVAAFGVMFVYPLLDQVVRRFNPASLPALHEAQIQIGRRIITPAMIILFLAGLYLALDRWTDLSGAWYSAAGVIIIVLLGLEHAFFVPTARRLRDLAKRDFEAGGGTVTLSAEYEALHRRLAMVGGLATLLVLIALFLMVVKPGA
jgi:hypothetical protein